VDDVESDDDATFIYTSEEDNAVYRDTFDLPNPELDGVILNATVFIVCRSVSPSYQGTTWIMCRVDENDYYGSGFSPSNSYTLYSMTWVNNPSSSSAWTWDDIDALEIGVRASSGRRYFFYEWYYFPTRVTQVYAVIHYVLEEEWIDCQNIGVNNTVAGELTLFSSDWTDINDAEGLSHFLFSTNNTGTWVNDTWSESWRSVVWADATKTLNSSEVTVSFRFYINNTEGTEYASTICYFPTYIPAIEEGFGAGYGFEPTGNLLVDGFMLNIAYPTLDLWFNHNLNLKGIFWTLILSVCIIGLVQQVFKHPKKQIVKVLQE